MSQSDEHVTVRATSRCKLNGCDSTGLNWVVIVQKMFENDGSSDQIGLV